MIADQLLKRRSVFLMIVLTVVTLGLYYPAWFLRRRSALNRLNSPRKLQRWPFVIFLVFFILHIIKDILEDHLTSADDGLSSPILLGGVSLSGLINRHIAGSEPKTA